MNYYLNAFNEMLRKRQMQNQMMGGSGGGQMPQMMMGGSGSDEGRSSNPSWDALSNAEKAAYYSANPTMAAITQGLQKGFGMTSYGMLQNALAPNFVREQQAIAQGFPNVEAYSGSRNFGKESSLPAEGVVSPGMPQSKGFFESLLSGILPSSNVSLNPVEVQDRAPSLTPAGMAAAAPGVAEANAAGYDSGMGNFGGSDTSNSFGEGQYNQGGMVNAQHLMGRAPAPDDGYGALQGGEYVITKAAVEKYGKRMMDAINNGTFR